MNNLFHLEESVASSTSVYNVALHQLYLDRCKLRSVANLAWYAVVVSCFLLDVVSIVITLVPFLDTGLILALRKLSENVNPRWAHYFFAQLSFTAILYTVLPLALLTKRLVVWQSLQSWNLVGIVIQLSSIPYARRLDIFSLAARAVLALCLRATIADLTFPNEAWSEQLDAPGQGKNSAENKQN